MYVCVCVYHLDRALARLDRVECVIVIIIIIIIIIIITISIIIIMMTIVIIIIIIIIIIIGLTHALCFMAGSAAVEYDSKPTLLFLSLSLSLLHSMRPFDSNCS